MRRAAIRRLLIEKERQTLEQVVGIETPEFGFLNGRDCIYIDSVTQDNYDNLVFRGKINLRLASKNRRAAFHPYELTFHRVLACFFCELDTYENMDRCAHLDDTDFNVVENSRWLENLPVRSDFDKSAYRHFQVFTYDVVYNIIAVSFDMKA